MVKLDSFPVEVLQVISRHMDGESIGRLWFTGSKVLIYKLVNHGVVRFEHKLGRRRTKVQFPHLVLSLTGLRELELSCTKRGHYSGPMMVPVAELPRGLESLVVTVGVESRSFATAPQGQYVPLPLRNILPSLTRIKIHGDYVLYPPVAAALPDLQMFEFHSAPVISLETVQALPSSLKTLRLFCSGNTTLPHETLPVPSQMESLDYSCHGYYDLNTLPSTLTQLRMGLNLHDSAGPSPHLHPMWNTLSRCLRDLDLHFHSSHPLQEFIAALPRALTRLSIRCILGTCNFSPEALAVMPPKLQSLSVTFFRLDTNWHSMPADCLKKLSILCFETPSPIETLRAPLMELELEGFVSVTSPALLAAFPHLTRLVTSNEVAAKDLELLPDSLSELSCTSFDIPLRLHDPQSQSSTPSPLRLPNGMKRFNAKQEGLTYLLERTQALRMTQPDPNFTCLFEGGTSLTHLQLACPPSVVLFSKPSLLPDSGLPETSESSSSALFSWSRLLPRTLTHLSITARLHMISDAWLQGLPDHSLKTLKLRVHIQTEGSRLPFTSARFLPDCLRNFEFDHSRPLDNLELFGPSDTAEASIPPKTATEARTRATILPSKLEKLQIDGKSILMTESHLDCLPPNLGLMILPGSMGIYGVEAKMKVATEEKLYISAQERGIQIIWKAPPKRRRIIS